MKHSSKLVSIATADADGNFSVTPDSTGLPLQDNQVRFTIKLLSHGNRTAIRLLLSPVLQELRAKTELGQELWEELNPPSDVSTGITLLTADGKPQSEYSPEESKRRDSIYARMTDNQNEIDILIANRIDPVYLKECLISIEGLEIDGQTKIDWKMLYESGNEELCKAIIKTIKARGAGLEPVVKENLESPITSGAPADGQASGSIAPIASTTDGIGQETATSTLPELGTKS